MSTTYRYITSFAIAFTPLFAFAQKKDLNYLISLIAGYLDRVLLLLMGVAVVMFVYYIVKFFMRPTEERKEGAKYLMWSVIGFAVILSMWGLVNLLRNTFNLDDNRPSSWSQFIDIFPTGTSGTSGNSN